MSEVKWIKVSVDMFTNRKIRMIESMENGDSLLVIWFKLLTLAGQINGGGQIYFMEQVPYNKKSLALYLNAKEGVISQALQLFEAYGMIEIDAPGFITIKNWDKYQNVESMERIKEQTRKRVEKHRAKKKEECNDDVTLQSVTSNATSNATVTECNAIDKDIDIDKEKDLEEKKNIKKKSAPEKHRYGEYNNVLLSDDEITKLQEEFPDDWMKRIETLSAYIASTGKVYKNHLATIRNWARMEKERQGNRKQMNKTAQELDNFYSMARDWAAENGG